MQKPVIVATNMLESMINHPTPTRAEVFYIAIAARERADAVMLSGETAHGKYPLKSFKVMHTVALRTESSLPISTTPPIQALLEPYGCNVCFSCHNNGQHPRHPHHCLYKDGIYGYTFKPLSALSSNFCLHKWDQPLQQFKIVIPKIPAYFTGTGDLLTFLLLGWSNRFPADLHKVAELAVSSLQEVLQRTINDYQSAGFDPRTCSLEIRLIQSQDHIRNPEVKFKAERYN